MGSSHKQSHPHFKRPWSISIAMGALVSVLTLVASPSNGQYGSTLDVPQTNLAPLGQTPAFGQGGSNFAPGYGAATQGFGPSTSIAPPSIGGLDPYAIPAPGGFNAPTYPGAAAPMSGGLFSGGNPAVAPPSFGIPSFGTAPAGGGLATPLGPGQLVPSNSFGGPQFGGPQFGGPQFGGPGGFGGNAYPSTAYPSGAPSTLFPGGLFGRTGGFGGTQFSAYRFLQGPRIRHTTVLSSDDPDALTTNDTDVSIAFAFPSFLGGTQPLYIVPSFSFHMFDGPLASTGADLPPNVYSAFLDAGWQTDPNQIFGAELGVRVGVFSEFDILRGDSLRVMGKGLGSIRLTPVSTFKLGVYYLDRNKIKLLPAGGLLWQPNPFTRFDIFFPQPKIARYWRTLGTRDVWWFAGGEYGGGNWTIDRDDGRQDEVDLNDIRVSIGLEWGQSELIRQGRRTGFVEFGYVFDRELVYRQNPANDINLDDGFMVRLGIGY